MDGHHILSETFNLKLLNSFSDFNFDVMALPLINLCGKAAFCLSLLL
jgi:hypothetical protein